MVVKTRGGCTDDNSEKLGLYLCCLYMKTNASISKFRQRILQCDSTGVLLEVLQINSCGRLMIMEPPLFHTSTSVRSLPEDLCFFRFVTASSTSCRVGTIGAFDTHQNKYRYLPEKPYGLYTGLTL